MAETITSEVVGNVHLPAGAGPDGAAAPTRRYTAHVSRPFSDTAPEIQELVRTVLGLYDRAAFSTDAGHKILSRFVYNASWDTPLFFASGTDRIRVMARGLGLPFWRIRAAPRLVTVSMINDHLGRIDVEGVLDFFPRLLWPLSMAAPESVPVHVSWSIVARGKDDRMVAPESVPVHVSWSIVARGKDDRVMSVTETLHNMPKLPYAARALAATAASTAALTVF